MKTNLFNDISQNLRINYILIILFILFSNQFTFAQKAYRPNVELQLVIINAEFPVGGQDIEKIGITFSIQPEGQAYAAAPGCNYYMIGNYNAQITTLGNITENDDIGFNIGHWDDYEEGNNQNYFLAKNKITITMGGLTKYFYYDTRDCYYYSDCQAFSNDVSIGVDYGSKKIWFNNDGNIDLVGDFISNGWYEINDGDWVKIWDILGRENCPLTYNGPPSAPKNFMGIINNQHQPYLSWDLVTTVPDIIKYEIYRAMSSTSTPASFNKISEVQSNINNWTDTDIWTSGIGDSYLFYKVRSVDADLNVSEFTSEISFLWDRDLQKTTENYNEDENDNYFDVFPNPFNPTTNISINIAEPTNLHIELYDITGKLISKIYDKYITKGKYNFPVDLSVYASGTYIICFKTDEIFLSKKIKLLK